MGPGLEVQTFDRMTLRGLRWFFRIVDCGNNEILAGSQPYKTIRQRDLTAMRLANAMGCTIREGTRR